MAPTKKSRYTRRPLHSCQPNVPPILTLRKQDPFDNCFKTQDLSDPFDVFINGEDSSDSFKDFTEASKAPVKAPAVIFSPCGDECSGVAGNNTSSTESRFFFPKLKSFEISTSAKKKLFKARKKKRRVTPKPKLLQNTSLVSKYEKLIHDCLKCPDSTEVCSTSSAFQASSTPVSIRKKSASFAKCIFSPIIKNEHKTVRISTDKHLSRLISNLSFKESKNIDSSLENFLGFPTVSTTKLEQRSLSVHARSPSVMADEEHHKVDSVQEDQLSVQVTEQVLFASGAQLQVKNDSVDKINEFDLDSTSSAGEISGSACNLLVSKIVADERSEKSNEFNIDSTSSACEISDSVSNVLASKIVADERSEKSNEFDLDSTSSAGEISDSASNVLVSKIVADERSEKSNEFDIDSTSSAGEISESVCIRQESNSNIAAEEKSDSISTDAISEEVSPEKQAPDGDFVCTTNADIEESIVNPYYGKESLIIISEQESLVEDDEDKSEDVSSALSSDQEAREGVSSSDLESNSIDEEKDTGYMEMRRHSYEKISPRKSYIVGPFSRRRRVTMVPTVLSDRNESGAKLTENEVSSFESNKSYISNESLNEQSHKSNPLIDSVNDVPEDERSNIGGRSPPSSPALSAYSHYENSMPLDPLPENQEEDLDSASQLKSKKSEVSSNRRRSNRLRKDLSPSRQSPLSRPSVIPDLNMVIEESDNEEASALGELDHFILPANKKYRRSLSIIRQLSRDDASLTQSPDVGVHKGRKYDQLLEQVIQLQTKGDPAIKTTLNKSYRKSLQVQRLSFMGQRTPPRGRRACRPSSSAFLHQLATTSFLSTTQHLSPSHTTQFLASGTFRQPLDVLHSPLLSNSKYPRCERGILSTNLSIEEEIELKSGDTVVEGIDFTFKDQIMALCEQMEAVEFTEILDERLCSMEDSVKVGEGLFGEVFMISRSSRKNVLKIIPIEGDLLVNGEKQKTFAEIYSELLITKWLDSLRTNEQEFMTVCFAELVSSWVVKGKYPNRLLELWDDYDKNKGSENDRPDIFKDEQLYLALELGNAGTDLESYSFSTAKQALSIFKQTAFALAVAETCFEFEHRDLHWGNVLISRTAERFITYTLKSEEFKVITNGVKSTIIDYTLSRISSKGSNIPIFCDIGKDPDMFIATGDYQFEIYRHMKKDVSDRWEQFVPKTNVRWLHYLIDKILKKVKYQRKTAKVHKDSMRSLQSIETWLLECDSSVAVALKLSEEYT